jgi:dinuclear metal center YbgI/SA1388 family protein
MTRDELTEYLDKFLSIKYVDDYSYNGLQIEGNQQIKKIGFAVDAGISTFQKAIANNVDFLIVHHGLFWKKQSPQLIGVMYKRVSALMMNDISLYAVHLPLDMHEKVGNNAGIIRLLEANKTSSFSKHGRDFIGHIGEFSESKSIDEIKSLLEEKLNAKTSSVLVNSQIKTFAVMSGACSRGDLIEAANRGVDLLITGEEMELFHDAHDYGISVIFAGHHATETVGVSLLKEDIGKNFKDIETIFIENPTGL